MQAIEKAKEEILAITDPRKLVSYHNGATGRALYRTPWDRTL